MASSARRRKTAWARTVRAATHSSCRSVAWSPSPSAPSRAAAALEILRRKPAAFGSQAPVVSATRGKNSTPCPRHAAAVSKWAALVSAYAEAAARLVRAASPKVSCREGAVTARSKAVGEPRYEGTYKSAGRRRMLLESSGCWGSRSPPFSFSGCNPARSTQVARMSRSAWWRTVRSPPAQHTAAWRVNVSNTPSQRGHQASVLASATPSRCRSSVTKTAGSIRVLPEGGAARKARAPGSASDRKTAWLTTVAVCSCRSQLAVSSSIVRAFWFLVRATSTVKGAAAAWLKACSAVVTAG